MTLVRFNKPANRLGYFPTVFSEMFDDFFNENVVPRNVFKSVPSVNIIEKPESYKIELAAPGMNKEDFKVSVEEGVIRISAEKKEEKAEATEQYNRKEFNYSTFERAFTLPENVNAEDVKAEYLNGILNLVLPKKVEEKAKLSRQIQIS
jgi:HSP20 family protein